MDFQIPKAMGVMGPKGVPDYILEKLENAFSKAVLDPNFIRIMDQSLLPIFI
jgi:tripartite-type tricarboxylate transporter receptor subunit TctC